jgi:hypothetical protein
VRRTETDKRQETYIYKIHMSGGGGWALEVSLVSKGLRGSFPYGQVNVSQRRDKPEEGGRAGVASKAPNEIGTYSNCS